MSWEHIVLPIFILWWGSLVYRLREVSRQRDAVAQLLLQTLPLAMDPQAHTQLLAQLRANGLTAVANVVYEEMKR